MVVNILHIQKIANLYFTFFSGWINCDGCLAKDKNSGHSGCKPPEDIMPFEISNGNFIFTLLL